MSKIAEAAERVVRPIVEANGVELVDVEYKKVFGTPTLTVYIDKPGGVSLDDCERVHMAIDAPLDELDPTQGQPYNLNVSSPGLDRPLKTARDFERKIGEKIEVSLYAPVDGEKKFLAVLSEVRGEKITLDDNGKTVTLQLKQIAAAKPYIEF